MKKLLTYILPLLLAINIAYGQNFDNSSFEALNTQQRELTHKQDSLQTILNTSRQSLNGATTEERNELSTLIVSLEGELFDIRAKLGRIGSEIASYEEQYAQEILAQASENSLLKHTKIYESDKLKVDLSEQDIKMFKSAALVENQTLEAINTISALYDSLCSVKIQYDNSRDQIVVDSLLSRAETLSQAILQIERHAGESWSESYNYILGLYIVILNSSPNVNRAILEAVDQQGRNVRREEVFIAQESLTPLLSAFKIQRELLISYEDAIAVTLLLGKDCSLYSDKAPQRDISTLRKVTFSERILTLYSSVVANYNFDNITVDDIEEAILPQSGIYYSIQIAMLSQKAQSTSMFRKTGPVQLQITPQGKYRYMIGGFDNYEAAAAGVTELKKIGFKAPSVVAFYNGEYITNDKAKALEKTTLHSSKLKVVLSTKDASANDTLTTVVEMHGAGKKVSKIMTNGNYIFTVSTFESKEEAEVFAQILRDRTTDSTVTVENL